jgi:hypothetical protein
MFPGNFFDLNPGQSFSAQLPFKDTVGFLKYTAEEQGYALAEGILVIEINEGVFIRSQANEWSEFLSSYPDVTPGGQPFFKMLPPGKWDALTQKYRAPLNSFGDERLVRWRVGFM